MKRILLALVLAVPMLAQQANTITASDGVVSVSITKAATLPGLSGGAMWVTVTPAAPTADVDSWDVIVVYRDGAGKLYVKHAVAVCLWSGPAPYPAQAFFATPGAVTVLSASAKPNPAEHAFTF
jgi:hypothetical protein